MAEVIDRKHDTANYKRSFCNSQPQTDDRQKARPSCNRQTHQPAKQTDYTVNNMSPRVPTLGMNRRACSLAKIDDLCGSASLHSFNIHSIYFGILHRLVFYVLLSVYSVYCKSLGIKSVC